MKDTIYRQAAIDALGDEPEVWTGRDEYAQGLNNQWHYDRNALKAVPSVQSEIDQIRWERDTAIQQLKDLGYGLGEKPRTDGDCISRQAVKKWLAKWEGYIDADIIARMQYRVIDIPSAQPEIIRCKDCRWGREACGNIECFADTNVPPEYHGYEWFCPNGERRTDE